MSLNESLCHTCHFWLDTTLSSCKKLNLRPEIKLKCRRIGFNFVTFWLQLEDVVHVVIYYLSISEWKGNFCNKNKHKTKHLCLCQELNPMKTDLGDPVGCTHPEPTSSTPWHSRGVLQHPVTLWFLPQPSILENKVLILIWIHLQDPRHYEKAGLMMWIKGWLTKRCLLFRSFDT